MDGLRPVRTLVNERAWVIALDASGGDHGAAVNVEGARMALQALPRDWSVLLVGREDALTPALDGVPRDARLQVSYSSADVAMDQHATEGLRHNRGSSLAMCTAAVKQGDAVGFVSMGNTGAVAAHALLGLGRMPGVSRPGLVALLPTHKQPVLVIDVGANVDCKPLQLVQFGLMASLYAECALGRTRPKVALLNVGEEPSKGNAVVREAHAMLAERADLHFVGNCEGRDLLSGDIDVVIADGFVGNAILKFAESVAGFFKAKLKRASGSSLRSKIGAWLLLPSMREVFRSMDYEEYGGVPLLGVDGVCIIGHGRSSARAISNAILAAQRMHSSGVNERIRAALAEAIPTATSAAV